MIFRYYFMQKGLKIDRILIAVEESTYSEKAWLYGYHLAELMKAKIGLVHVLEPPAIPTYVGNMVVGEAPNIMADLMTMQEESTKALFERITKRMSDEVQVYTFVKMGNVKTEILDLAEEWKADLIILGTHGRTGIDHFIAGSVAEGVARKAHCPVLIIPNKKN